MCGRRHSDKQRIAELFAASVDLEELYFGSEDEVAPGSMQPVIRINDDGERKIEIMSGASKEEDGKLLFNARAESINDVNFWKKSFSLRRCIVPADSFFEWEKTQQGKKPKFEFTVRGGKPVWHGRSMGRPGSIRRPIKGKTPSRS
jgi:putative SOS response-associated peptidase YedK